MPPGTHTVDESTGAENCLVNLWVSSLSIEWLCFSSSSILALKLEIEDTAKPYFFSSSLTGALPFLCEARFCRKLR